MPWIADVQARVKERIGETGSTLNTILTNIVTECISDLEARMGRTIESATYTEYYDGSGMEYLVLRQGPLGSVTSVNSVAYGDSGGSRTETLTVVNASSRLEGGLLSEGHLLEGWIRMLSGVWTPGRRNYKIVYVAGFTTVPPALTKIATEYALTTFLQRESAGMTSKQVEDQSANYLTPNQLQWSIDRAIKPYRFTAFA